MHIIIHTTAFLVDTRIDSEIARMVLAAHDRASAVIFAGTPAAPGEPTGERVWASGWIDDAAESASIEAIARQALADEADTDTDTFVENFAEAIDEDLDTGCCAKCAGSGEGYTDGSTCSRCKGTGDEPNSSHEGETDD